MKLSLNIQTGSLAGRSFELTEGFLTVGRGERCNVRFDPLQERIASKEHCYIELKPDGFYITDNQSTNGTILNGEKVQSAKLNSGDRIQFGKNGVEGIVQVIDTDYDVSRQTRLKQDFQMPAAIPQSQTPTVQQYTPPNFPQSETLVAPVQPIQPNEPVVNQVQSFQQDFYVPQPTQMFQSPSVNFRNSLSGLGMGTVPPQFAPAPEQSQTGKYVFMTVSIFLTVVLSLIVILIMYFSVGVESAILASLAAFVPAMFYLLPLVWLDRYDPEPAWLLALCFAWGALVAVVAAFVVNTAVGYLVLEMTRDPFTSTVASAVVSAPVIEEGIKGLGIVLILIFFRKYFDDILDGIVFAGVIGLGFATVENVLYYGRGILEAGSTGFIVLFVLRGIMSPFAHVTFTAMTGIGCGISRESHNTVVRIMMPVLGYGCAVLLHAIWNGMAVVGGLGGFLLGYIFLEIPFFLIFVGFAFYVMYRQNKILKEMLAIDVARGLIPPEHLHIATSAFRSTGWLLGSMFSGNFKARNNYLRSVGKLGLSYWHIQRATAAQGQTASFQQNPILREEVLKWRGQV